MKSYLSIDEERELMGRKMGEAVTYEQKFY